jgi:transcriptional regulator with XRE-family HTH domain
VFSKAEIKALHGSAISLPRLGNHARALRENGKWSQDELAHESGLARSFTEAIDRGEKDLRLTTLVKLANAFRVPTGNFFK